MVDNTLQQTLDRLDAACARLEAAAVRVFDRRPASGPSGVDPAEHAALVARHSALRETLASCLGELDGLIADASEDEPS